MHIINFLVLLNINIIFYSFSSIININIIIFIFPYSNFLASIRIQTTFVEFKAAKERIRPKKSNLS